MMQAAWSCVLLACVMFLSTGSEPQSLLAAFEVSIALQRFGPTLVVERERYLLEADSGPVEISSLRALHIRLREWHGGRDRDQLRVRVIDGVDYGRVVEALDVARGAGFQTLSVSIIPCLLLDGAAGGCWRDDATGLPPTSRTRAR